MPVSYKEMQKNRKLTESFQNTLNYPNEVEDTDRQQEMENKRKEKWLT